MKMPLILVLMITHTSGHQDKKLQNWSSGKKKTYQQLCHRLFQRIYQPKWIPFNNPNRSINQCVSQEKIKKLVHSLVKDATS
jgi:hypothetical protein